MPFKGYNHDIEQGRKLYVPLTKGLNFEEIQDI
jgi:hypothetical protein